MSIENGHTSNMHDVTGTVIQIQVTPAYTLDLEPQALDV
jgi:hypothetical protein